MAEVQVVTKHEEFSNLNESEAFNKVEELLTRAASKGIRPGLERITRLMSLLDNPQDAWPAIHVVGTNGKGSTCAFLASVLRAAGYRVALYTSPHLESPSERLLINGEPLSGARWLDAVKYVTSVMTQDPELVKDPPSYFELVTAAAFWLATQEKVDIGVIEAGLGGRLDATNLLGRVECSVVASISMDHIEFLGDTLDQIAGEKFAVVRKDRPACFVGRDVSVIDQFKSTCAARGASAYVLSEQIRLSNVTVTESGCGFDFACDAPDLDIPFELQGVRTGLIGHYQLENASLALMALSLIKKKFFKITNESILQGMGAAHWPGRLEIVSREPLVILDGGHNRDGVAQLVRSFKELWPDKKTGLVYAAMRDKEYNSCLALLNTLNLCSFYATEVPGMARCLPANEMCAAAKCFKWHNAASLCAFQSPVDAVKASLSDGNDLTLVCGSLYLLGWIRPRLIF